MKPVVVVGGGHNGLIVATLLARPGHKVVLLERRDRVGGAAATDEFAPGYRVSSVAHTAGPLHASVIRELGLDSHVDWIRPEHAITALHPEGRHLTLSRDAARSAAAIGAFSARDAARWPVYARAVAQIASVLERASLTAPPDVRRLRMRELLPLAGLGLAFRRLGRDDGQNALRWLPMAVADFAREWFETPLLQALVAAQGVRGIAAGPRSAGTTANLLFQAAWSSGSAAGETVLVKGGLGALSDALAGLARNNGVDVRTGAAVRKIETVDGAVRGVVLANGDEIPAGAVVSAADPKHTLLSLLDATALSPDDHLRVRCFRAKGMASKVHLALRGLPRFRGFDDGDASRLQGRIQVGPEIDSLERAFDAWKYGEISPSPYLDITIPSLTDPSLAPAGRHVMSIHVQYTPRDLRSGDWSQRRDEVRDVALRALAPYAPDLAERVEHAQVLTPADLETTYGLTGGHPHHGEHALDQLFTMRPLWGWPAYRTPVRGLYLCSAGTHPGGGVTGLPAANAAKVIAAELRSAR